MDPKLLQKLAEGLAQGDPEAQKVYAQLPDEIKAQVDQMVRQMQGGESGANQLMALAQAIIDGDQRAIQAYKALSPQEQQAVNQAIEQIKQGGQQPVQQTNIQPQGQSPMMAKHGIRIKK